MSNTTTTGRTFILRYAANGHEYLYSFADSRREELIAELQRQADDPNHPLTDWDFLRLVNIIRLTTGLEAGGFVDATSPYASCTVSCTATERMPSARVDERPAHPIAQPVCDTSSRSSMGRPFDNDRDGCVGFALGFFAAFCGFLFFSGSAVCLLLIAQFLKR